MCLKAVDVREIDKANGTMIVLQLTPKVDKDMYLFVSGSRVINSNTSGTFRRRILTELTVR